MTETVTWVDSHCHLEMIKEDTQTVMTKSHEEGLAYCVTIGTSQEANLTIKEICAEYEGVYGTLGFHPHGASDFTEKDLDWVREELRDNPKMVAVGECGFDLYYEYSRQKDQAHAFRSQLDLAVELNLPVVIHSRDADSDTNEMLKPYHSKGLTGVVHCFSSDIPQAKRMLDAGFYLSFNGISTFPQAQQVRDVLAYTPLDRILLETDAPYLSPVPFRGKKNIPGRVAVVGRYIAEFLNLTEGDLSRRVAQNTKDLFNRIDYEN